MRKFWLASIAFFCLAGAWLALSPVVMADGGDPIQDSLDRLAALDPAGQQAWLKRLEERAEHAVRWTAKPKEHAEALAAIREKLHQKAVTLKEVREVIEATDALEKEAVVAQAKKYRLKVFEVFHAELHVYGDRQRAWLDLQKQWVDLGSPFETQDRLLDWLEAALASVSSPQPGESPKWPKLEPPPVPAKVKTATAGTVKKVPPAAKPQAETKVIEQKKAEEKTVKAAEPKKPRPLESFSAAPETNVAPPEYVESEFSLPPRDASAKPTEEGVDWLKSLAPEPMRLEDFHLPEHKASPIKHPQPVVSESVLRELAKVESPPKLETPPESSEDAGEMDVAVNVEELAARISGCNLAFRALEADLDGNEPWSAVRLEPLLKRLEILLVRRRDLDMFRQALSESDRKHVDPLAEEKDLISLFASRIVAARERAKGTDFDGTEAERKEELQRLEKLSQRVAESAEE